MSRDIKRENKKITNKSKKNDERSYRKKMAEQSDSDDESSYKTEEEEDEEEDDENNCGEMDKHEYNKFLAKLFPSKSM